MKKFFLFGILSLVSLVTVGCMNDDDDCATSTKCVIEDYESLDAQALAERNAYITQWIKDFQAQDVAISPENIASAHGYWLNEKMQADFWLLIRDLKTQENIDDAYILTVREKSQAVGFSSDIDDLFTGIEKVIEEAKNNEVSETNTVMAFDVNDYTLNSSVVSTNYCSSGDGCLEIPFGVESVRISGKENMNDYEEFRFDIDSFGQEEEETSFFLTTSFFDDRDEKGALVVNEDEQYPATFEIKSETQEDNSFRFSGTILVDSLNGTVEEKDAQLFSFIQKEWLIDDGILALDFEFVFQKNDSENKNRSMTKSTDFLNGAKINWEGCKIVGGCHTGTVTIASDTFSDQEDDETFPERTFVIDMTSLDVTDLDGEQKKSLETHLKSEDFF